MFNETRSRSFIKAVGWRIIAVINSFMVLLFTFTSSPLWNAILMNITGGILYYFYERLWNKSNKGRCTNENL